jgi:hypothetical protein
MNHVRAVLASRNADLEGRGGRDLDQTPEEQYGLAVTVVTPVTAAADRDTTSACAAGGTARFGDITDPPDQSAFLMFQNSANGVSRMSVTASRDTSGVKYSPRGTNGTVCAACA